MINSINFIGDIHGRTVWKELVKDNCINVFVGDYFDPYDIILIDDLIDNFNNIIEYKKQNMENTILLLGNHDAHYLPEYSLNGESSRYNKFCSERIKQLLLDNIDLFYGIAYYHKESNTFTSHAGVSSEWFKKWFTEEEKDPQKIEYRINNLWKENPKAFSFSINCSHYYDCYGNSFTHSPLWIRSYSLSKCNLFKDTGIKQIIGHTQTHSIIPNESIVIVDILGNKKDSLTINFEESKQ